MKPACVILTIVIVVSMFALICMVKFATEITVEERKRELQSGGVYKYSKMLGVVSLNDNHSTAVSERFPYVAAVMRNYSSSWSFSCFGSIILLRWVLAPAHCRKSGATHRVLLYYDYVRNFSHTYPILFWRVHEKFNPNNTTPMYDVAVAKLNIEMYPYFIKSATFDEKFAKSVEAAVWKTVSTMDRKTFLTSDFEKFDVEIAETGKCYESYGIETNESLICVDMSRYEDDCFVTEFGPLYAGDRIIGILAVKPRDCDNKLAIFTNVSTYTNWILRSTHITNLG